MNALAEWQGFYTLIGSAAGAFATPTIVHFGTALLLSGVLSAPWRAFDLPAAICGCAGLSGAAYVLITARRMRLQTAYRPELSDWFFYAWLPLAIYAALAGSAFIAASGAREGWFGIGAAALLFLFIGIHNAWDNITYHVFVRRPASLERPRDERADIQGKN